MLYALSVSLSPNFVSLHTVVFGGLQLVNFVNCFTDAVLRSPVGSEVWMGSVGFRKAG